jgi:hypothetical protein
MAGRGREGEALAKWIGYDEGMKAAIFLTLLLVANDQATPPPAALPQLSQPPLTSCEATFRKSDLAHMLGGLGSWLQNGAACAPPPSPSAGPTIRLWPRPTPPPPRYPF